jgi:hypothetical protein
MIIVTCRLAPAITLASRDPTRRLREYSVLKLAEYMVIAAIVIVALAIILGYIS